jgi:hypothetical protein
MQKLRTSRAKGKGGVTIFLGNKRYLGLISARRRPAASHSRFISRR